MMRLEKKRLDYQPVIFFMFLFMVMGLQPLLMSDSSGIELVGQWDETPVNKLFIRAIPPISAAENA